MWLAHSLTCYDLATVGLALSLFLFFALRRELGNAERDRRARLHALGLDIERLSGQMDRLEARLREAEERSGMLVPPAPPRSGLNLTKRTQALRLSRRGESPEQIAALLALPRAEVDLLLKVHRMVLDLPEVETKNEDGRQ